MNEESPPTSLTPISPTDPDAAAWEYDEALPNAGLTLHVRGASLKQARVAILLFHGYGAEGDDLVALSQVLTVPSDVALVFPQAPVVLPLGGRAWFRRDRSNIEKAVIRARKLILSLCDQYPQLSFVVGGFSQGAMLSANLIEQTEVPILAGVLLSPADVLVSPLGKAAVKVPVFLSHGTVDAVLPFAGAESLKDQLLQAGHEVNWVPFVGRHQIPMPVIDELNVFLGQHI